MSQFSTEKKITENEDYLEKNSDYWSNGYDADNVESWVFRPYGAVFCKEFGLDGTGGEKLLDFGCGRGAGLRFFRSKGFDVYGVDINKGDIECCRKLMPEIAGNFAVIEAKPKKDDLFFGGNYDIVIAVQVLYYFSDTDFRSRLQSLYDQMNPGGVIYASMIGSKHWFYRHSAVCPDGLRVVNYHGERTQIKDYFVNFTENEDDLRQKFDLFEKIYTGYYAHKLRDSDGDRFHYTFIGRKKEV